MKVGIIEKLDQYYGAEFYRVELIPNWLERLFGVKPKYKLVKRDTTITFVFGDANDGHYTYENGEVLNRWCKVSNALNKHRRMWRYEK